MFATSVNRFSKVQVHDVIFKCICVCVLVNVCTDKLSHIILHMIFDISDLSVNMPLEVDINIEKNTRGQSENPRWQIERQSRLTASSFHEILHARDIEASCRKLHERKIQHPYNIAACKFGLESEVPAMKAYARQFNDQVGSYYQPGLCVSTTYPQLAATPDFIVYSSPYAKARPPVTSKGAWLVEIKTFMPNKLADNIHQLAILRGSTFCCAPLADGTLQLRKEHKFYTQIIGQLNIVFGSDPLAFCDLVLYYNGEITTIRVYNDLLLWKQMVKSLLKACDVYNVCNIN